MKTVLVVDDEQDVRLYLARLLQEGGYNVITATDGDQAMREVLKQRPDLITLDLSMPETSGVKFYRDLKARPEWGNIPVVFITGVTGVGGARDTERFYANRKQVPPPDAFLAKPIDPEEMLATVGKLIAKAKGAGA